ncbi:MAG: Flp family type IVb pilin [Isosphaeraceae bacterium]|jgi:pilus assembly protein Flp/PilA
MLNYLLRLYRDDQAAAAVEYAVLLALILVAIISAISALGSGTSGLWAKDVSQIDSSIGS